MFKCNIGLLIYYKYGTREEILEFSDYYSTGKHLLITEDNTYTYNDNEKQWYKLNVVEKNNNGFVGTWEKIDDFEVRFVRRI